MALVNPAISPIILAPSSSKDSRWLTLEVCREFARSKCSRTDEECKYAHPPSYVEIQNGRVTCCFDSIKGKCQRKDPPCKYLHPPQHLKEILLQNGRQNLILKNLQMQTTVFQPAAAVVQLPGVYPVMPSGSANRHPYILPSPLGYAYYSSPSIGNVSAIVPTYEHGGTVQASMATNQVVGSLSGTSVVAAPTNGLSLQLVDSTPSVTKQLENSPMCGSSSTSSLTQGGQPTLPWEGFASPSGSVVAVESTNLPYCQPFFYKRQVMEVMTAMGRKRPHEAASSSMASADDLIRGVNAVPGMIPVLKRPALVDPKSGLPMYRQYATTAAYPSASALTTLQLQQLPQFFPLTIAGTAPVIPHIN